MVAPVEGCNEKYRQSGPGYIIFNIRQWEIDKEGAYLDNTRLFLFLILQEIKQWNDLV